MSAVRMFKNVCLRVLRYTPVLDRMILPSAGYKVLDRAQAERFDDTASGWHNGRSAGWQERAYQKLLNDVRAGNPRLDFRLVAQAIQATEIAKPSVLEVGCGNGYYSEILARLVTGGVDYTGLDYSQAMVESAHHAYPHARFVRGDATKLDFASDSFDIVLNGVSLMHILGYADAIREAARVARAFVIFNCVPVLEGHPTIYLRKYAYGAPTLEMCFSAEELTSLFDESDLEVVEVYPALQYDLEFVTGVPSRMLTYLCRKRLKA